MVIVNKALNSIGINTAGKSTLLFGSSLLASLALPATALAVCPDLRPYYQTPDQAQWPGEAVLAQLTNMMPDCLESTEYFALLGETVTITLRIQDMTAELAQPILVGECAARQLSDQNLQSQGSYLLSGLRIPHTLFAPPLQNIPSPKTRSDQPSLKLLHGGRQ